MIDSEKKPPNDLERHVVLVSPEIHWNTGNTGRTCLATGARLHLIKPLGFSLACRQVKRAGLDYWPRVDLAVWDDFDHFLAGMTPDPDEVCLFTKLASQTHHHMPIRKRMFLVFGSETRGLPAAPPLTLMVPPRVGAKGLTMRSSPPPPPPPPARSATPGPPTPPERST